MWLSCTFIIPGANLDWQKFWELFDKLALMPPVATGDEVNALCQAYRQFGVDPADPVQVYVAIDELADNAEMLLSRLDRYRGHRTGEVLGAVFANACDWMLRELWLFVPEDIRNKSRHIVAELPLQGHTEGLDWRLMATHAARFQQYYYTTHPGGADTEDEIREMEQLGGAFREGMSADEVRLRVFLNLYALLRLERLFSRFLYEVERDLGRGFSPDIISITLASWFHMVVFNLPPDERVLLVPDDRD